MPTAYVKKLAKKHHTSISKAEGRWSRAKKAAAKQGHEDEYDYITGIFKHMMGEGHGSFSDFYHMEILAEGTWSAPQTIEKAQKLLALLKAPISAKDAGRVVYNLMGDDDLYDQIDQAKNEDPNEDVRPLIVNKLQNWIANLDIEVEGGLNSKEHRWTKPWEKEAVGMLRKNTENEESAETIAKQKSYLAHRDKVRSAAIAHEHGEDEEMIATYQAK